MKTIIISLLLSLSAVEAYAQDSFFTKRSPFERTDLTLSGRLRHLTLENLSGEAGREIVLIEREGNYPEWRHFLEVVSVGKTGKPERGGRTLLPSDVLFYCFAVLPEGGRTALILLRPTVIEAWFQGEKGFEKSPAHHASVDPVFHFPEKSGPTPFECSSGGAEISIPSHGGIAIYRLQAKALILNRTIPLVPTAFYRSGVEIQPLDLPFWVRGSVWFPKGVEGSLMGAKERDIFYPWMDEVFMLRAGSSTLDSIYFKQLTDAERDDEQGYAVTLPEDLDGDGHTDFLVNKFQGPPTALQAQTTVFMTKPNGEIPTSGVRLKPQGNRAAGAIAVDFNKDGKKDLAVASSQFNAWAIVRALLQKQVSVSFAFYLYHSDGYHLDQPDFDRDISFGFDLSNAEISGLLPTLDGDFNGDGFPDALYARDRKELTILLQKSNEKNRFSPVPSAILEITVPRSLRVGDLNGDKRSDIVLFDTRSAGNTKVTVLANRGTL